MMVSRIAVSIPYLMHPNFKNLIILYAEDYDDDNDGIYDEYDNDDDNDGIPDVIVSGKPNGDIWTILKKENYEF